jgi:hypothetical protein
MQQHGKVSSINSGNSTANNNNNNNSTKRLLLSNEPKPLTGGSSGYSS